MLDLNELEYFTAFSELGTLSRVSEHFHISAPTITRSMQHVEDEFGVSLFIREKNRIRLNETGTKAVECAKRLLNEERAAIREVRNFDMSLRTVTVKSCAPAPLWKLLPEISSCMPEMMVNSAICQNEEVIDAVNDRSCDIAILPWDPQTRSENAGLLAEIFSDYSFRPYMSEHLFVCVRPDHELASHESVTLSDINGYNFLLRSELGFWDTLCRESMPSSRFLVQTDEFEFQELIRSSSLPCFATDYVMNGTAGYAGRICIPVTDDTVNVTFYIGTKEDSNIRF